jgi:hypothetical protein
MNDVDLSRVLRRLPLDARFQVPRAEVADAFDQELTSNEGRSALYAFADIHQCRVEWVDGLASLAFVKRRNLRF